MCVFPGECKSLCKLWNFHKTVLRATAATLENAFTERFDQTGNLCGTFVNMIILVHNVKEFPNLRNHKKKKKKLFLQEETNIFIFVCWVVGLCFLSRFKVSTSSFFLVWGSSL